MDAFHNDLFGAEGFDDSQDDGWKTVGKKGKKGKNGAVVPRQTRSLQNELISATGQESWWSDSITEVTSNNNEIDSLPLWGGSTLPPHRGNLPFPSSQRGSQITVINSPSPRKYLQTASNITYSPPVKVPPRYGTSTITEIPSEQSMPRAADQPSNHWIKRFKFKLACSDCFTKNPAKEGIGAYQFYQWPAHKCAKDQILCNLDSTGSGSSAATWGLIRHRTNLSHQGNFQLCIHFLEAKPCKSYCHFAHSEEEMEIWLAERNGSFDRREVVASLCGKDKGQMKDDRAIPHQAATSSRYYSDAASSYSDIPRPSSRASSQPMQPSVQSQIHSSPSQQPASVRSVDEPIVINTRPTQVNGIAAFPHRLRAVCKLCAETGVRSHQRENVNFCSVPDRHDWEVVAYHALSRSGSWVEIHTRETSLSPYTRPEMCKYAYNCFYEQRVGKPCRFPHYEEEIELWNYQARYKLYTVEEVIRVQRKGNTGHVAPPTVKPGNTGHVVPPTVKPANTGHVVPPAVKPTQEKVQETEWRHRDPPFVFSGNYRLCKYNLSDTCSYSRAPEEYNFCSFAHSEEELKEWKLRHLIFFKEKNHDHRQQPTQNHGPTTPAQASFHPRPSSTEQNRGTTLPAQSSLHPQPSYTGQNYGTSVAAQPSLHPKPSSTGQNYGTSVPSQDSIYPRPPSTGQNHGMAMPSEASVYPKPPPSSSTTGYGTTAWSSQNPPASSRALTPQYLPNRGVTSSNTTQTAAPRVVPMVVMPKTGLTQENVKKLLVHKQMQQGGPFKSSYYHQWIFLVRKDCVTYLRRVDLRPSLHQRHFQISHSASQDGHACEISFRSTVNGFFQQQLLFDFGSHDLSIILFLTVVIGQTSSLPHTPVSRMEEPANPRALWTSNNSTIVPYSAESQLEPFYQQLVLSYPPPPAQKVTFQPDEGFVPGRFKGYLHKLIQLEEKACNEKMSKFCCSSELVLTSDLREVGVYQSALEGELFGMLKMGKGLTDNSDASQIVTRMTHFILIKFNVASTVVYQSQLFYGVDHVLQQDDAVFVRIGKKCVQDEKLKVGSKVKVHVQFELDRVKFCSMHYGVDHFNTVELAFPPSGEPRFPKVRRVECEEMNPKQESAARYILGAGTRLPFQPGPTLISGPFGTGKTHTVAKIAIRLLLESSTTKILIAAHTNSAADWYITEHLHPLLTRLSATPKGLLLRIYATIVEPVRVNKVILENYTLLDGNGRFKQPLLRDVVGCRIVITTLSTAIHLVELGQLYGQFTHIFIDEAGQALETEAMIPLGLAGPRTVVVLAGDHKQMKPEVYSKECQQRRFQISMLERLVIWNRSKRCGLVQNLSFNYRMRPEILQFIAQFYDGKPMEPMGDHRRHPDIYPVSFCEVNGLEQQRGVSYVNDLEAQTIVILLKTIVESSWPTNDWGDFKATNVAVITPYMSQVKHIRSLLRRHKLGQITVERIQNMQGKQFRMVFISTVHTRNGLLEEAKGADGIDQSDPSEEPYRGFLSEEGELVTAFTRSQSLLFVVGDPVALCTVGACRGVWWRYLQECEANNSMLPEGTTMQTIMADIQASKSAMGQASQVDGSVRRFDPLLT